MDTFDATEYFRKAHASASQNLAIDPGYTSEFRNFEAEARVRKQDLDAQKLQAAAELARRKEQEKNSWGGELSGSLEKSFKETAAAFVSGSVNAVESVGALASSVPAMLNDAATPATVQEAYNRAMKGEETAADIKLLNSKTFGEGPVTPANQAAYDKSKTWLDHISETKDIYEYADKVSDSYQLGDIVNGGDTSAFFDNVTRNYNDTMADNDRSTLGKVYDLVEGLGSVALSHPSAVGSFIVEEMPEMVAGASSLALRSATNLGHGVTAYREGLVNYRNKYGEEPPAEEKAKMFAWAMGSALIEQGADTAIAKPINKLLGKAAPTTKGAKEAGSVLGAPVKIGGHATIEGATEGAQTYAEGQASHTDVTGLDMYKAAAAGFAVGGGMSSPGVIADSFGTATKPITDKLVDTAKKAAETETNKKHIEQVAQDGEVKELFQEGVAPTTLVEGLQKYLEKDDLDEEKITRTNERIEALTNHVDNSITAAEKEVSVFTEAGFKAVQDEVAGHKAQLEEMTKAEEPDVEAIAQLEARINQTENYLDSVEKLDAKEKVAAQEQVTKKLETLKKERSLIDERTATAASLKEAKTAEAPTEELLASVRDESVDEVATDTAVDELVIRAMRDPGAMANVSFERVLSESSNLSESSKEALQVVKDAQLAYQKTQSLDKVQSQILDSGEYTGGQGTYKFSGLSDYRNTINNAIRNGNLGRGTKALKELTSFAANQTSKHAALKEARELATKGDGFIYVVPEGNNEWGVTQQLPEHIPNSVNGRKAAGVWTLKAGNAKQIAALDKVIDNTGTASEVLNSTASNANVALKAASNRAGNANADIQKLTQEKRKSAPKDTRERPDLGPDTSPEPVGDKTPKGELAKLSARDLDAELEKLNVGDDYIENSSNKDGETKSETPTVETKPKKSTSSYLPPSTGKDSTPEAQKNSLPVEVRELLAYLPTKDGHTLFSSVAQAEQVGNRWRRDDLIGPFQVIQDGDGFALFEKPKPLSDITVIEVVTDARGNNRQVSKPADVSWRQRKKRNKVLQELLDCVS